MSTGPSLGSGGCFRPNIERRGRVVRGVVAAALLSATAVLARSDPWVATGVGAAGLFIAFEATRGWCAVRACGVKTPL